MGISLLLPAVFGLALFDNSSSSSQRTNINPRALEESYRAPDLLALHAP